MERASASRRSESRLAPRRLELVPNLEEPAQGERPAPGATSPVLPRLPRRGEVRTTGSRLCRLPMVRAGATRIPRDEVLLGSTPTGLSELGRREVRRLRHYWEWAEAVVASPLRRARETALLLAGQRPVTLEPSLRPRELGPWEGRSTDELRAVWPELLERWQSGDADFDLANSESPQEFQRRVEAALDALLASPYRSVLVVSHQCVIRAIAALLVGPLPPGRPWPAEMVLITRREGGRFGFGRRSSDPEPLRSPLERCGLSGRPLERPPERHVAPLTLRGEPPL